MFDKYYPFSGENVRDHLDRHRHHLNADRDRVPVRRHLLSIPIVLLDDSGKVFLKNMLKVKKPSPSACVALPVASYQEIEEEVGLGGLVKDHIRNKIFTNQALGRISVRPLEFYKNYATECAGLPVDVTNLPAEARLRIPFTETQVSYRYQKYRGEGLWLPLNEAFELLSEQSEQMPNNNLAQQSLVVMDLHKQSIGRAQGVA